MTKARLFGRVAGLCAIEIQNLGYCKSLPAATYHHSSTSTGSIGQVA